MVKNFSWGSKLHAETQLSYKDDVDLEKKLDEWERFYNFARPHRAFSGKTPTKHSGSGYE